MKPEYYAQDAAEWRGWLKENHASASKVWLIFFKKHTGKPSPSYNEAVEEALCWGWVDSIKRRVDDEKYAFKFTPRKEGSGWSPSNIARVEKLLKEGKMTPAGMKLVEAARASDAWARPIVPPTFEMPDEFKKALQDNKAAGEFFETLPPSQKKQYIGWIASAKRVETRARRLSKALEMLKSKQKLGMV
ncbi:MAG: YdeI/OmpD-associated family protein [Proteobacteria bacterium]|nr:YdeI/OmpD-associated family protein [Pseudomonadota bacterium]